MTPIPFFTAISIKQPWVEMILNPRIGKDIENRLWNTRYRGPLLIHASKSIDKSWHSKLAPECAPRVLANLPYEHLVPRGCLCGTVIVDTIASPVTRTPYDSWHQEGYFGHHYIFPEKFDYPFHCNGKLGLFKINPSSLPNEIIDCMSTQFVRFRTFKSMTTDFQ